MKGAGNRVVWNKTERLVIWGLVGLLGGLVCLRRWIRRLTNEVRLSVGIQGVVGWKNDWQWGNNCGGNSIDPVWFDHLPIFEIGWMLTWFLERIAFQHHSSQRKIPLNIPTFLHRISENHLILPLKFLQQLNDVQMDASRCHRTYPMKYIRVNGRLPVLIPFLYQTFVSFNLMSIINLFYSISWDLPTLYF